MQSAYNEIQKRIESAERGTLFFPDDFAHIGSSDAIRSALVRLCRSGIIVRVAHGIYYYPKIDTKWRSGIIPPDIEEIANGIAKRDKVRIAPTGAYALNLLGLSTQVPANAVFITDGSPRRVTIGKGKGILFKHTSEMRNFAYQSRLMMLIVTAMREIGEGNVTNSQMKILKSHLKNVPADEMKKDIQLAPAWVRKKLLKNEIHRFIKKRPTRNYTKSTS
ncbi:Transcriptional regulator, AbiEi antitoxin, Type IV TA system [Porphyromonadaceae bacterium KH3CP3RA]|nr:Transcriptional regulator, AbiEi antitoxin, Type IV TA system [Porphyromonadaceae bacterium KH3CP3RA]